MIKKYLHIILIFASGFLNAQNQEEHSKYSFWVNSGLGISSVGSIGINGGINYLSNNIVYTFRGSYHVESTKLFSYNKSYYDFGFLIGYAYQGREWHTSLSTGLSGVAGFKWVYNGNYNCLLYCKKRVGIPPVIGIPIEIQFSRNFNIIGVGLGLVGNYNSLQPFVGLNFNVFVDLTESLDILH